MKDITISAETSGKSSKYRKYAAVCFGVHAVNEILMLISLFANSKQYGDAVSGQSFILGSVIRSGILIAAYVLCTVGSISRKNGHRLLIAGFFANLLYHIYRLTDDTVMLFKALSAMKDQYFSSEVYVRSIISDGMGIAAAAIMLFILFTAISGKPAKHRSVVCGLWFVPAVLAACVRMDNLIKALINLRPDNLLSFAITCLLTFAYVSALLLTARWTAFPGETAADAYDRTSDRINMVGHVLLLLFTFGIWQLIWIYRTTAKLNDADGETYRSPTKKLLLCMFVPFYYVYWTNVSAERIGRAARKEITSRQTVICTILAILAGIVPPILIQEKLNEINM